MLGELNPWTRPPTQECMPKHSRYHCFAPHKPTTWSQPSAMVCNTCVQVPHRLSKPCRNSPPSRSHGRCSHRYQVAGELPAGSACSPATVHEGPRQKLTFHNHSQTPQGVVPWHWAPSQCTDLCTWGLPATSLAVPCIFNSVTSQSTSVHGWWSLGPWLVVTLDLRQGHRL